MLDIFKQILNWSEIWVLLIPLIVLLWSKNNHKYLLPIRKYLFVALILNITIVLISELKGKWGLTENDFFWNNNVFYNISSIVRLLLFAWFFILLRQRFMHRVKAIIPFAFLLFVFINFIFFEKFVPQGDYEWFSSRLLATEAALLLFYCLQYFIYLIIEEKTTHLKTEPGFWVVTGLSIYVAANFFIYLFYEYLSKVTADFAVNVWDVHNIAFIILCVCIAKQFNTKHE
jgi:hypothetical protein